MYKTELNEYKKDSIVIYKEFNEQKERNPKIPPPLVNNYARKPSEYFIFQLRKESYMPENYLLKFLSNPTILKNVLTYDYEVFIKDTDNHIYEVLYSKSPRL